MGSPRALDPLLVHYWAQKRKNVIYGSFGANKVFKTMFHCNTVIELRVSIASWHCCYSIEFLLVQNGSAG